MSIRGKSYEAGFNTALRNTISSGTYEATVYFYDNFASGYMQWSNEQLAVPTGNINVIGRSFRAYNGTMTTELQLVIGVHKSNVWTLPSGLNESRYIAGIKAGIAAFFRKYQQNEAAAKKLARDTADAERRRQNAQWRKY